MTETETGASSENTVALLAVGILGIALVASGVLQKIIEAVEANSETIVEAVENYSKAQQIEKAGWLPHPTFPIHLLEVHKDGGDELNKGITQYYADSWAGICTEFERQFDQRGIDGKAKEHFKQMLRAHGMGLFSLVPRAVFPELEIIWRSKFGAEPLAGVTSHKELMKALGEKLSLADASPRGIYGFHLFSKLYDHVFKPVSSSNLAAVQSDPVPNRHAALHGYVVYDTAKSSLNALIMADYMLHLFDALDPSVTDETG